MRPERLGADPFLDHDEGVRSECSLNPAETLRVDGGAIFDAARLRPDSRNVGRKRFEHALPLARIGGDNGENMDHGDRLPLRIR